MKNTLVQKLWKPIRSTIKLILLTAALGATLAFSSCSKSESAEPVISIENKAPIPLGVASAYEVRTNEDVIFQSNATTDPDGNDSKIEVRWDFDGDKTFDTGFWPYTTPITHKFTEAGNYFPVLEAKDEKGKTATKELGMIKVIGNMAPVAKGQADKTNGLVTDTYNFDWSASSDSDGDNSDLEARVISKEGGSPSNWTPYGTAISYAFTEGGNYNPILEVKDKEGGIGTATLDNLGVLGDVNPISIEVLGPSYLEYGEEAVFNIKAQESDGRPLSYSVNFGEGFIESGEAINKTYNSVGVKNLEAKAVSDYNISNVTEKEINVGPGREFNMWMTDKMDGKKYRFVYVDNLLISSDDFQGMTSMYEGKTEEAPFYDNDSITYSSSFGKLYNRDDVNKGLEERVFIHETTGVEYLAHVTTHEEFDKFVDAYGGKDVAGKSLKYNGFDSNGDNSSWASYMLGGTYSDGEFGYFGVTGQYFTGTDYGDGRNVVGVFTKDDDVAKNLRDGDFRAAVKYTIYDINQK